MLKKLLCSFIIAAASLFASLDVWAQPTASFTVSSNAVCAAPDPTIIFTNTSTGAVSCFWDFGDGIGTNNTCDPTINYTYFSGAGSYTVTLTVTDAVGTTDQATVIITVWNLPTASFFPNTPNTTATDGCAPFEVCFTDQSTPGDTLITAWLWTFGDGGSANTAPYCYTYPLTSAGIHDVSLQVVDANGCSDTVNISNLITVHIPPTANFSFLTLAGNLVGCHPTDTIQFTDNSIAGDTTISSWEWDFGDATTGTGPNPIHPYNFSGNFPVQLIITDNNGCKDTIIQTVQIDDYQANFTASPTTGCGQLLVTFTDATSSIQAPNQFSWSFPGGTPSISSAQNPTIQYTSPGQYSVTLTSTNVYGCSDDTTIINLITVYPLPQVGFFADTLYSCQLPFDVTFTDTTPSAPPGCGTCSWVWDIDNWDPILLNYDWSTDYLTSTFTHSYTNIGSYNVSVIVTDSNGCVGFLVKDIYIRVTEPIADFIADTSDFLGPLSTEGCIPLRVHFRDMSIYDSTFSADFQDSIVNWYWDFGDGYTISGGDSAIPDSANNCLTSCTYRTPTHFYVDTGVFDVTLAITTASGCTDTITMTTVAVGMIPVIEFAADDTTDCFPFEVNFFDLSSSFADSWYWDFGDGGNSTQQDPTYIYQSETGYFDVSLAASFYGCASDTLVKDSMIYVDFPQALFNIAPISGAGLGISLSPNTFFCYEDTLSTGGWEVSIEDSTFGANSILDSSFLWVFNFGDSLAPTFESVDTTIIIVHDTVFVLADTIIIPEDTIFFSAGDTTLFSVVCDSDYFIIIPPDTLYLDADTIDTPNDTIRMKGDYMIWMGMPTDTVILMPDTTIITYTYAIIPPEDTIIDSTFTIYMMSETTFITADTTFGCDTNFTLADSTIFEPAYTVVTTIGADTLYYIPHDSVRIDTAVSFFQPDTVFYVSRDTIVYVSADTVIIGSDTLVLAIDTIIRTSASIFSPADTFFVGVDTIPPDTTITPADTNWTDPGFSPIDTIFLGGIGGCDTLFVVNDSIITPADTSIIPEFYLAKLLKHTYTTTSGPPALYTNAPNTSVAIKLYAYNSITGCLDSIENFVNISNVNAGFTINAPFGGDTLGCLGIFNALMLDTTTTIYDIAMRHWDFGDGCTLTSYATFLDAPIPADSACGTLPFPPFSPLTSGISYSSPNHVYTDSGTYTITLLVVDRFGCRDSVSHQVVVKNLPVPIFVADTTVGCADDLLLADLEVTFSDTSSVFQPAQTVQWVWNYGDGNFDTTKIPVSPTHTYDTPGIFNAFLTITDEFGCVSIVSIPQFIPIITSFPTPYFIPNDIFSPVTNCSGDQVNFILVGASGNPAAPPFTHYWDWCDGSFVDITNSPTTSQSHTFINLDTTSTGQDTTTIFNVTLTIEDANGCMQDTTLPITIQQPVADFTAVAIDIDTVCPSIYTFYDFSSSDVISWNWDFGDGKTSVFQNPTNNYVLPGVYDVTLIVSNGAGCVDTVFKPGFIVIRGAILIDTSMSYNCSCAPCTVTFTAVGFNTDIYRWVFPEIAEDTTVIVNADPANPDTTSVTITYVFTQSGIINPVLTITDPADSSGPGCPYDYFLPPIIIPGPVIDFFTNDTVCGPRDVIFNMIDTSGTSDVDAWLWNFDVDGLGGVSPTISGQVSPPVVNYSDTGSYTVSLTAFVYGADTCVFTLTKPQYITVFELPYTPIAFCPDSTITFSIDTSIIPLSIDSLVWSFEGGGSATGNNVEHTYTRANDSISTPVAYDVTLDLYNNGINVCTYVFPDYVTVYPTPTAIFYIDPVVSGVQTSVSFTDTSIGATSWEWDFGDGISIGPGSGDIIGINPSGTYENLFYSYDVPYSESQSFTITLTVYNDFGCSDDTTAEKTIELKIPNVFAPGSDKPENAVFFIGGLFLDTLDLSNATLKLIVFNRWGQKVYENDHYEECDPWNAADKCWDGTDLKGKPLNTDTYYYVLNFNDRSVVNGFVMIWRPE